MRQRKKFKTGKRTTPAPRKNEVLSTSEFVAKRKEDALALAQLVYDMFIEQEPADEQENGEAPGYIREGLL